MLMFLRHSNNTARHNQQTKTSFVVFVCCGSSVANFEFPNVWFLRRRCVFSFMLVYVCHMCVCFQFSHFANRVLIIRMEVHMNMHCYVQFGFIYISQLFCERFVGVLYHTLTNAINIVFVFFHVCQHAKRSIDSLESVVSNSGSPSNSHVSKLCFWLQFYSQPFSA